MWKFHRVVIISTNKVHALYICSSLLFLLAHNSFTPSTLGDEHGVCESTWWSVSDADGGAVLQHSQNPGVTAAAPDQVPLPPATPLQPAARHFQEGV